MVSIGAGPRTLDCGERFLEKRWLRTLRRRTGRAETSRRACRCCLAVPALAASSLRPPKATAARNMRRHRAPSVAARHRAARSENTSRIAAAGVPINRRSGIISPEQAPETQPAACAAPRPVPAWMDGAAATAVAAQNTTVTNKRVYVPASTLPPAGGPARRTRPPSNSRLPLRSRAPCQFVEASRITCTMTRQFRASKPSQDHPLRCGK